LKDAGLSVITMGVQSGSPAVLAEYNRPVPPAMAVKAARDIIDAGVDAFFDLMTMSESETEQTCRETFEFLLDFPREMKTVGFYPMTKFPGYGYSRKVAEDQRTCALGEADYAYYHRLYLLTRTKLPRKVVRAIGNAKLFRRFPTLIDPLLPKQLPFFYLDHYAIDLAEALRSASEEQPAASDDRPLPVSQPQMAAGAPTV
jgi:radical SAM superfamily enzyme YgiQ (UPF0313 family)